MTAINMTNVTVTYGGEHVLKDLSLQVHSGRIHALVGRNGAGKSTAFRSILGLTKPVSGRIEILGQPRTRQSLRHIGASINGPATYSNLSATDNLHIHTLSLGLPRSEIHRVLDIVGLTETGKKRTKNFSTGMKARLALGIALLGRPEILILDEPHNGLDPQGITQLRALLRSLADAGTAVLVSSHQLSEVAHIADDISVLANGSIRYSGPLSDFAAPEQLEQHFLHLTESQEQ